MFDITIDPSNFALPEQIDKDIEDETCIKDELLKIEALQYFILRKEGLKPEIVIEIIKRFT